MMGAWSRSPMGTAMRQGRPAWRAGRCFAEAEMAITTEPTAPPVAHDPAIPDVPIYRLSVEQYHAMAAAGILSEDDPVELLEDWLVQKMTKNPPHVVATGLVRRALEQLLPSGWYIAVQDPISVADSDPEPALAVVRGDVRDYLDRHPGPKDVALVVEVAETSLKQDRELKQRLYARASITVYWIVNLVEQQIEVYSDPTGPVVEPTYGQRHDYGAADTIPVVIGGNEVGGLPVRELLP
jgi:Putative restriction endonuclease